MGFNFYNITYKVDGAEKEETTRIFYRGDLVLNNKYWIKVKDENFSFVDKVAK